MPVLAGTFFTPGHFAGQLHNYSRTEEKFNRRAITAVCESDSLPKEFVSDSARDDLRAPTQEFGSVSQSEMVEIIPEGGKGHLTVTTGRGGVGYEESITYSDGKIDLVEAERRH